MTKVSFHSILQHYRQWVVVNYRFQEISSFTKIYTKCSWKLQKGKNPREVCLVPSLTFRCTLWYFRTLIKAIFETCVVAFHLEVRLARKCMDILETDFILAGFRVLLPFWLDSKPNSLRRSFVISSGLTNFPQFFPGNTSSNNGPGHCSMTSKSRVSPPSRETTVIQN